MYYVNEFDMKKWWSCAKKPLLIFIFQKVPHKLLPSINIFALSGLKIERNHWKISKFIHTKNKVLHFWVASKFMALINSFSLLYKTEKKCFKFQSKNFSITFCPYPNISIQVTFLFTKKGLFRECNFRKTIRPSFIRILER